MTTAARRAVSRTRGALAVLVSALVAHAALYHSLWPADGAHGYFIWYEPLVAGLSLAAVLALACILAAGVLGVRGRAAEVFKAALRPRPSSDSSATRSAARLAAASLGLLLVQESLERSIASGSATLAIFTPAQWLLLVVALSGLAAALVLATRSCSALLEIVFTAPGPRFPATSVIAPRAPLLPAPRRASLLSSGGALRAPPLLAG